MKIREIHALRGPNYWSIRRHKLIVMVLDLEEMENRPSDGIDGFSKRLENMFPGMYEHRCSEGVAGGFFSRVKSGTWMGHIVEHIALEIQTLAGMDVGFGRTRGYGEDGVYNVVFDYMEEEVGIYAANASVNICMALVNNQTYDLAVDIQEMKEIRESVRLGPSTGSIVEEAISRGIPWIRLNRHSLVQLGYGSNQKRIQATVTCHTSNIGVDIAGDKVETKYLLEQAEIPVSKGEILRTHENLQEVVDQIGFPLVTKPVNGNHGRGVTININNFQEALNGFNIAQKISSYVLVERQITGEDYRLLVINNKLVAASKRTPAHVVGDGKSTIKKLIDKVNEDPRRGYGHEKMLTLITIDKITKGIISSGGYTLKSVLKKGEKFILKDTANLSTGGTAEDVTDMVHPANLFMAERISKIIDLDICGIDVITTDISEPLADTNGAVIEVNAGPGFRMHLAPTKGLPRNVAAPVIDELFPHGNTGKIPIIAVTGTNGKTTTTRLIAHMARQSGYKVGFTTSDGVYIQNRLLMKGDCTGPGSTEFVLKDPTINFAVLECARGGILRSGLGFHNCDIGIVTNVTEDHLGLKGIHTIQQLAQVKGIIPESVVPNGYAILNADDDLVYRMRKKLVCNIALFSMNENSPRIKAMQKKNGLCAIYENGFITICKGEWKIRIMKAVNIPLTFGGKAEFMIQNVLPAVLASYLKGVTIEDIKLALQTFNPSPAQTPGRLNLFQFKNFQVLLDYAHNPAGMRALQNFVQKIDSSDKVGIIAGVGDRKEEDTKMLGSIAAEMFDEIIIRQDKNLRGRSEKELIDMLTNGINEFDSSKKTTVIPNEKEAVLHAIKNAKKDSLIVICSDVITEVLALIQKLQEEEANNS